MPGFELFGENEKKHVQDVLNSGILMRYNFDGLRNGHWKAQELEEKISSYMNVKHAHLCTSGTTALTIALACCGIGKGDEVIVPPFTFVATVEAVINTGAIPVFGDVDETLCLSPESVKEKITEKTKAVMPVHMCGSMAKIDLLKEICNQNQLVLIEDACQAVGASFNGHYAGTIGDMGCFSFDFVKTITCGEGGAVITNKEDLYDKAHKFADHGHDHIGIDRGAEDHPIIGMNYRISELHAAVGLGQMERLNDILTIQRKNKKILKDELKNYDFIKFRELPDENGDNAGFLSFFMTDEGKARETAKNLNKNGADGSFYWFDNKWHYFKKWQHMKTKAGLYRTEFTDSFNPNSIHLENSDKIIGRTISMLIKLSWTENDLEQRIAAIKKTFNN